jgi:hypothetical protein
MFENSRKEINVTCPKELKFLQPQVLNNLKRAGNSTDGGYAISTDALARSDYFLSMGLGENWSFEEAISETNAKAAIDIYDNTVSLFFFAVKFLKGLVKFLLFRDSLVNLNARFSRLANYFRFWMRSASHHHHQIRITKDSFRKIISNYPINSRIGLKIDIEGSEWEILGTITENEFRFEFILIEIHDFENHESELKAFLNELDSSFVLAHLHANNFETLGKNGFPNVFELTLIRKSSAQTSGQYRQKLPVPNLDLPNAKNRPDFLINFE